MLLKRAVSLQKLNSMTKTVRMAAGRAKGREAGAGEDTIHGCQMPPSTLAAIDHKVSSPSVVEDVNTFVMPLNVMRMVQNGAAFFPSTCPSSQCLAFLSFFSSTILRTSFASCFLFFFLSTQGCKSCCYRTCMVPIPYLCVSINQQSTCPAIVPLYSAW